MINYILHFTGRKSGAIGKFEGFRFEGEYPTGRDFVNALYKTYEHISAREFYIDGDKADFHEFSVKVYTEAQN